MSVSKTRRHLVDVARDLFARKGLESTTMNDIAAAANRGRRTVYTYFRSKEELYTAVVETELDRLSEKLDEVAAMDISPEHKLFMLAYTHLNSTKETVGRNGSLRAEFFRNIWTVETVRRAFDREERHTLRRIIQEGVDAGKFHVDSVVLMADIFHFALKGLEVPYIYDRLGIGVSEEAAKPLVMRLICRVMGMVEPDLTSELRYLQIRNK
ncbi:MAG: TetR/AcrR family transcriptional regulator [Bacteroidaceae bacterium]|nr:TetR/AcrR family transcriptional regulator [Bacteroidaceae bacterium]MBR6926752.1 TetR/AcrR family transcriptional regulator [Bacteroidaceae bacterium]